MNRVRSLLSTWRGRAILFGVVAVVALFILGAVSSVRERQQLDAAPAPSAPTVSPLLPSLAQPPAQRWAVPVDRLGAVLGPVGGDAETVIYQLAPAGSSARIAALRASTGEVLSTVDLGAGTAGPVECSVTGPNAVCTTAAGAAFVDVAAGRVTAQVPVGGDAHSYVVAGGFLVWSESSAPAVYQPNGQLRWRASGTSFSVVPGSPVLYALDKRSEADGEGRVLAVESGKELVKIAVKQGQQVRFSAWADGFSLERLGEMIRFFAADGRAYSGVVSAEGGQQMAEAAGRVTSMPILLERRDEGVTLVGVDPSKGRNLWKQQVPQRDPSKVRISGIGQLVIVEDGDGHCAAYGASTGEGGAIPCGRVLGTDGTLVAVAPGPDTIASVRPGTPAPAIWTKPATSSEAFGGALYDVAGRLS